MYQWEEDKKTEKQKKLGGGEETVTRYTYERKWSEKAIDSSRFRNAADHRNPPMPSTTSRSFAAPDAKLGGFALNERVISMLPARDKFEAPASAINQARAKLGPRTRIEQGMVYAGANPDQPVVGDVRVSWELLPVTAVSVVARQTQSTFSPWVSSNGREVLLAETGVKDAALLFKHGQDENRIITWILRFVGVLLMFIGFRMMLALLEALADVIPFLGDVVGAGASIIALLFTMIFAPLIIAIAWLFYRPLIAGLVIAGGVALVWGVRELGRRRALARAPAQMPQGAAPAGATSFLQGGSPLMRR
jgi:hypothetical protein